MRPRATASRTRFALAALPLALALGCSRPVEAWIAELESDEPLTRALAAAALGTAPTSGPDAERAVQALFRAYDPRDARTAAAILWSLDHLAPTARPQVMHVLRSEGETADWRRLRGLAVSWLTQTRVAIGIDADPAASPTDRVLVELIRWHRAADAPAATRLLREATPWLTDPDARRAAASLLADIAGSGLRLRAHLDAMAADAGPWCEVLIATLAHRHARGDTTEDIAACLKDASPELEAALLAGAQGDDLDLARLCCIGLGAAGARSDATLAVLRRLAREGGTQAVRDAAGFALQALGR